MATADPYSAYDAMYGRSPAVSRRPKRDIYEPRVDREAQDSLLQTLGGGAMGGLTAITSLLDLPGSMVRDALSLGGRNPNNPFDQLLTPFSPENRTSGRDLLRGYGMVGPKDTWGNFLGGLAVELPLDPLAWASFGGSSVLTGAGKAAKAAGGLSRGIGNQIRAGQRGLLSVGAPLTLGGTPIGAGNKVAAKIGDALSVVDDAIKYGNIPGTKFSPGRRFAAIMDPAVRGVENAPVQRFARESLHPAGEAARSEAKRTMGRAGNILTETGLDYRDPMVNQDVRFGIEKRAMTPSQLKQFAATMSDVPTNQAAKLIKDEKAVEMARAEFLGMDKNILDDPYADHWTRHTAKMDDVQSGAGAQSREFGIQRSEDKAREEILKNLPGVTRTIQKVSQDADVESLISRAPSIGLTPDALAVEIAKKYRQDFGVRSDHLASYFANKGAFKRQIRRQWGAFEFDRRWGEFQEKAERLKSFSKFMMEQPEPMRKAGIFPNNPFFDAGNGLINLKESVEIGDKVLDFLASPDAAIGANRTITPDTVPLGEVLQRLGFSKAARPARGQPPELIALKHLRGRAKQNLTAESRVPKEIADSLVKYVDQFRNPQSVSKMVKALDTYTNIFKLGVTGMWPAYHVRNLLSSQWNNVVAGQFSGRSLWDTQRLLSGKDIEDAAQIPAIRELLRMERRTGNSREATRLIRELAAGNDVIGPHSGLAGDIVGASSGMNVGTLEDVVGAVPGARPFTGKGVVDDFLGRSADTTWDPRKATVRGIAGRQNTTQPIVKGTEDVAYYVEGLARISPFIHKLRRMKVDGLNKKQILKQIREAADEVGASQVKYGGRNYTPFEKDYLKRLIPFYSFTSRMMPWMLRQLAERPGGRLAQTMRASVAAKDPNEIMPEYVSNTAAIPVAGGPLEALLGTPEDGGQRFITGFGLAHEDPLSFFGSGLSGGLMEVLSRSHPLVKAPLQLATNQSFFQQGPLGGRPLEDLDPTIGRLIANVTQQKHAVRYPGDRQVEALLETLPISRLMTSLRTATDTRKGIAAKAVNLGTGVRLADVSPTTQDALYRERMKAFAKRNLGARTFETDYVPDYNKERLTDAQKKTLEQIEAMKRELVRRRQVRKAEESQAVARIP